MHLGVKQGHTDLVEPVWAITGTRLYKHENKQHTYHVSALVLHLVVAAVTLLPLAFGRTQILKQRRGSSTKFGSNRVCSIQMTRFFGSGKVIWGNFGKTSGFAS